jgi:SAM-dependent methyltransferase
MHYIDCAEIYSDGRHYDRQEAPGEDVPFYVEAAKKARGRVLELCCGTGRIAIPIAEAGIEVVGLDISKAMLATAKKKAAKKSVGIRWVEGDCRSFSLGMKFDLIFMAYNSLHHIHTRESAEALFACVKKHLTAKGKFIIDVFNPSLAHLTRNPDNRYPVCKYENPDGKGNIIIDENNVYDDATQINKIKWHFFIGESREKVVKELNMRCFFPQELDLLLHYNGFKIVQKHGDFAKGPFTSGSKKQVVICEKAANNNL